MLGTDNKLQLPGSPTITEKNKQHPTVHYAVKPPCLTVQENSVHFQFMMFSVYGGSIGS